MIDISRLFNRMQGENKLTGTSSMDMITRSSEFMRIFEPFGTGSIDSIRITIDVLLDEPYYNLSRFHPKSKSVAGYIVLHNHSTMQYHIALGTAVIMAFILRNELGEELSLFAGETLQDISIGIAESLIGYTCNKDLLRKFQEIVEKSKEVTYKEAVEHLKSHKEDVFICGNCGNTYLISVNSQEVRRKGLIFSTNATIAYSKDGTSLSFDIPSNLKMAKWRLL